MADRGSTASATVPCRLCGGPSTFAFRVGDRNRALGPGVFEYRRCGACEAIALTAVPEDLGRYYVADGYGSVQQTMTTELYARERAKLDLMPELSPPAEVVEIGPGAGLFTRAALLAGLDMTVLESDPRYCEQLGELPRVRAIRTDAPEDALRALEPVQAVVMWHAIEHLPRPWAVLERSAERLLPGGLLALSTPNPDSLQFRLMGGRWHHVDAPRHLQLIPLGALERRLERLDLRLVRSTTADPVGDALEQMGWEGALRRRNWRGHPSMRQQHVAHAIRLVVGPWEKRRGCGAAYTAVFRRGDGAR